MQGTDAGPPASQASARVFVDSAEQPLQVFVEAAELFNRPRIIRTLRNNGAVICHSAEESTIILVDPQTGSGTQFIQEWGAEPGKAVLDVRWVYKSVERKKAFLEDELWGGFHVGAGASDAAQNTLPTPRETPPDAQAFSAKAVTQDQHQDQQSPPNSLQFPANNIPANNLFPPQSQPPQMSQQVPMGPSNGPSISTAGLQSDPNAQVTLPAQLFAQLVGFVQQGMGSTGVGMPQVPQMTNQTQLNMLQGQAPPQAYLQQNPPFIPQLNMFPPPFALSQQAPVYHPPQHIIVPPLSQMQTTDTGTQGLYQPSTPASPDGRTSSFHARRQSSISDTARGSPMEDVRPSLKRRSPSIDRPSPSASRKKGKGRADGERSNKHRRISYSADNPVLPYQNASPPSTQPSRVISESRRQLFAKDDGTPYFFFVQIDIRPRTRIADAIKKNGGKLVPDISNADFIILGSPSTRTFEERLRQASNYGKLAVRPQWVFECVERNEIVQLDDFVFEGMTVEKKRGRPSATGKRFIVTGPGAPSPSKGPKLELLQDHDVEMDDGDDDEGEGDGGVGAAIDEKGKGKAKPNTKATSKEVVQKETARKEPAKKKKKIGKVDANSGAGTSRTTVTERKGNLAKSSERSMSPDVLWRPSPPPPTRAVLHMAGKYQYTKEDLDYVDEYLPILLLRDPDMTQTAICSKLNEKMPHHSLLSWMSHIGRTTRRDELEKLRRQAHIARRKATAGGRPHTESERRDTQPQPTAAASAERVQEPNVELAPESFDAFTVLTTFFVSGGADNLDDADVWQALSGRHPEMSPAEWEHFWAGNSVEITAEVERLSQARGSAKEAQMQCGEVEKVPKPEPE
ncbi:hypothetical protein C8Q78DRAFT_146298 [Trametes maxima]|nr:hypothetical protein C8Q78DRAFT_146298 [Trametes maxima]